MIINKVNLTPIHNFYKSETTAEPANIPQYRQIKELSGITYRDFNINFGARLFRSPENFYEQPFNQKNMPDSMREYLYTDYNERKNIPPALMMKLVFEDINSINSLDFIKRHYKNEPLFENLSDKPKRQARKGIVSEIEALKSEMDEIPLFKDGNSNFGVYVLRKIYFEGKTLNEINKDFKKDLSEAYEGLITSQIDYDDINAYGIKFPKTPFWKSFIVTREDFPYVYRPRKAGEQNALSKERTLSDIMSGNYTTTPRTKKQRYKVKDNDEAKRIGDALINGHGNVQSTEKALRSKGIRDTERLSFVSKYLSQIMSIALEKTHASDEMRSFFENYDNMNKKQKEKLEAYWKNNSQMRELQSLAISDTIKLFFEVYEDGTNMDEFQELLDYANSIKPNREAYLKELEKKQLMYEDIFKDYNPEKHNNTASIPIDTAAHNTAKTTDELLVEEAMKNGAEIFSFIAADGKEYKFVYSPDEMWRKKYKDEYYLMPTAFVNKCINFVQNSKLANEDYYRIMALSHTVPSNELERIMPSEEYNKISEQISKEFSKKNIRASIAAQQAAAEALISRLGEEYIELMGITAYDMCNQAKEKFKINEWTPEERTLVDARYHDYMQPLSDKHVINELSKATVENLAKLGTNAQKVFVCDDMDNLLGANLRENPELKSQLAKALKQFKVFTDYGSSSRFVLRDDVSDAMKMYKARLIIEQFMENHADDYIPYLLVNYDNIGKYITEPDVKMALYNKYYQIKK